MQQVGQNRFVRSPDSQGWVCKDDLPIDKVHALYARLQREREAWLRGEIAALGASLDPRKRGPRSTEKDGSSIRSAEKDGTNELLPRPLHRADVERIARQTAGENEGEGVSLERPDIESSRSQTAERARLDQANKLTGRERE
jgi:hypothetical protein